MKDLAATFLLSLSFAITGAGMDIFFLIKYFVGELARKPVDGIATESEGGLALLILGLVVGSVMLSVGIFGMIHSRQKKDPSQ